MSRFNTVGQGLLRRFKVKCKQITKDNRAHPLMHHQDEQAKLLGFKDYQHLRGHYLETGSKTPPDIEIDFWDWMSRYQPICDLIDDDPTDGDLRDFHTRDPADIAMLEAADPNCIWTLLDVDPQPTIVSGKHFVNRMNYYITKVPHMGDNVIEVLD